MAELTGRMRLVSLCEQKLDSTLLGSRDGVGGGVHFVLSPVFARIKKPSGGHSNSTTCI